ncbi:hypothetical protein L596_023054 [Steinernema carpocapsae]|uniref:Uncharacterized protein n=1 Tax=Steinernema carpocapsae TaxID=34508 RepID=A0A4U5MCI0_STECR|nr:hypothetical protein L596_023054 [Steinernema carpocapsae]
MSPPSTPVRRPEKAILRRRLVTASPRVFVVSKSNVNGLGRAIQFVLTEVRPCSKRNRLCGKSRSLAGQVLLFFNQFQYLNPFLEKTRLLASLATRLHINSLVKCIDKVQSFFVSLTSIRTYSFSKSSLTPFYFPNFLILN